MLDLFLVKFRWPIGPKSHLSLKNKRLINVSIFHPAGSYEAEIWGTAASSNVAILERFQNNYTWTVTGSLRSFTNKQLLLDLKQEPISVIIHQCNMLYQLSSQPSQCRGNFTLGWLEQHPLASKKAWTRSHQLSLVIGSCFTLYPIC